MSLLQSKLKTIDPGSSHRFEFIRPLDVSRAAFSGQTAETTACQPATLKDFTAIFADGSGIGVLELIDQQFVIWQAQQNELKHWLGALHSLRASPDTSGAINSLRDSLTHEYDDCEDRPLANGELTKCQINREVWHQVNGPSAAPAILAPKRWSGSSTLSRILGPSCGNS